MHISTAKNGLNVPNLERLGLSNIYKLKGINTVHPSLGYYTKMQEASCGKDTMTGHWEMMGLYIDKPFQVFPDGFPNDLIALKLKNSPVEKSLVTALQAVQKSSNNTENIN